MNAHGWAEDNTQAARDENGAEAAGAVSCRTLVVRIALAAAVSQARGHLPAVIGGAAVCGSARARTVEASVPGGV